MRGHPVKDLYFVVLAVIAAAVLVGYAANIQGTGERDLDRSARRSAGAREAYEAPAVVDDGYNLARPQAGFSAVAQMVDELAARSFGGAVTVAVPDDELPLVVMEINDWSEARAKQALCAAAKLLARAGALESKEGVELRCEEAGRGVEGPELTLLAHGFAAKRFASGLLSTTRFLRQCELTRQ